MTNDVPGQNKTSRRGGSGRPKFKPQFRRLLFIDRALRNGAYPNCTTLADEWQVSAKTMQRDIDYLKDELEAPIAYDTVRHGLYYTDKTWFLPSVMLNEGELFALLVGAQALTMFRGTPVAGALRGIFEKLAGLLPDTISLPPEYVAASFSFVSPPARPIREDIWKQVARGTLHRRVLRIQYRASHAPAAKAHTIHPYHLVNLEGDWYVLARDVKWKDLTPYALSRIQAAELTDEIFERLANFNVEQILRRRFGRFLRDSAGKSEQVRLLFVPELATYIGERTWHPQQRLHVRRDGAVVLTIPVPDHRDAFPWVLSFGARVRVLAPPALRRAVRQEARRMISTG